jgi:large subunit ribosomal protein L24
MKKQVKQPKMHLKKGDIVEAITGEDAAGKKTGKVLQVFPQKARALVEGFNYVKKHMRKTQDNPQGGIVQKEAPIAISNLKLHSAASEQHAAPAPKAT